MPRNDRSRLEPELKRKALPLDVERTRDEPFAKREPGYVDGGARRSPESAPNRAGKAG